MQFNIVRLRPHVAIYARTFNAKERVEDQVSVCNKFASSKGWTPVKVFTDLNNKNVTLDRMGISSLINAALPIHFDIVLCTHSDRLSPNIWELRELLVRLEQAGVQVWSTDEGSLKDFRTWFQVSAPDLRIV